MVTCRLWCNYCRLWAKFFSTAIGAVLLITPLSFAQAPTEKTGNDIPNLSFHHEITLNIAPGLLSHLRYAKLGQNISAVRALMVLDDKQLVVPFVYSEESAAYSAIFPTPQNSLRYQLELTSTTGQSVLSPLFASDTMCYQRELGKVLARAKSFNNQAKLIEEVSELDREVELLKYLVYAVDDLTKVKQ